ncbi:chaperone protein DnaJ 1, mitochondrial isoform X1 [Tanacetum coccineum]
MSNPNEVDAVDFEPDDDDLMEEDTAVDIDTSSSHIPKLKSAITGGGGVEKKTKGRGFRDESDADRNNRMSGRFDSLGSDGGPGPERFGHGYPVNAKAKSCPTCEGTGTVFIHPFMARCGTCKGLGHIIKEYCRSCGGSGVVEVVKEVKVEIPAGVESGGIISVPRAGRVGRRGQPGTLTIKLKVADDPVFQRDGADLYVDSNIAFTQAIVGGKVDVPTLNGKTQVKVRFFSRYVFSD